MFEDSKKRTWIDNKMYIYKHKQLHKKQKYMRNTFKFVSKADARLAVYMHLLNRPSPSFKTQFRAAADGREREYPIPIARNIA